MIVSTYQAASGAGAAGMAELKEGIADAVQGDAYLEDDGRFGSKPIANAEFAHPLAFNVIPHIDKFQENGYTKEEMKVTWECRKMLGFPPLPSSSDTGKEPKVSCTAVRIPYSQSALGGDHHRDRKTRHGGSCARGPVGLPGPQAQ